MKKLFTNSFRSLPLLIMVLFFASLTSFAQNLTISGGNNFSVSLCENSGGTTVYAWGSNISGQVGPGAAIGATVSSPIQVTGFTPVGLVIKQVDGGSGAHTVALDCNKNVWVWGENKCGQGGQNTSTTGCTGSASVPQQTPLKVKAGAGQADAGGFLTNIVYVSGGNNTSFGVEATTGKVLAWGENTTGEVGDGTTINRSLPVYVLTAAGVPLTGITQIEGGDDCTFALDKNGNVWAWGANTNSNLGRNTGGANGLYAQRVETAAGVPLSGITQISGGDTHCLALSSTGEVYSWGGDWGPGQLGQGAGYQTSNIYASRVLAPTASCTNTNAWQVGPFLTGATYVSAGQASSAVLLSSGNVVTFGASGLYPASTVCGTGLFLPAGTLGNGTTANVSTCTSNSTAPYGGSSECPVYVMTNSTTKLSNVTTISDGDAWYFATTTAGTIYSWGWNREGELGVGTTSDRNYAAAGPSISGCSVPPACPKANLGPGYSICPGSTTLLNSNQPTGSTYTFAWGYSATGVSGTYTTIAGATSPTYTATQTGAYRVIITDSRISTSVACGACPLAGDTILISPISPPWTATGTYCASNPNVQFTATDPTGVAKFQWFLNQSPSNTLPSGATVTTTATKSIITLPETSSNTTGGASCPYSLYVMDTSTYHGALEPTAPACQTAVNNPGLNGSLLMINVRQSAKIDSLQFIAAMGASSNGSFTYTIYNAGTAGSAGITTLNCNSPCPSGGPWEGVGSAIYTSPSLAVSTATAANLTKTLKSPTSPTLAPGTYWIGLNVTNGGGTVNYMNFSCAETYNTGSDRWTSPIVDNTGNNIMQGVSGAFGNEIKNQGSVFNIRFSYDTPYNCTRLLVCATLGSCPLPVDFIRFDAISSNGGADLTWATASEKNSSYFSVEKSLDGVTFHSIGTVNAAGNSSSIKQYVFRDGSAATPGIVYYRLTEYDLDGQASNSEIKYIRNSSPNDVTVVPNPSNGSFTILVEGDNSALSLVVYNTMGQVVYQAAERNNEGGTFSKNIDIQNLAAGVYVLHVNSAGQTWTKKIIKE